MDKKRILVIDDERDFTRMVKINLEDTGEFEVRVENNGAAGLEAAKEFNPDLILLDVMMPEMDGTDVCMQLRSDTLTSAIPVIFLTAIVKEEDVKAGRQIGGNLFIAKPIELKNLIEVIKQNIS